MSKEVILRIDSQPDPNPPTVIDGLPATYRPIDYKITVHGERFVIPEVWALQTSEIGKDGKEKIESYLDPDISSFIQDAIFRHTHPKEAFLEDLMRDRIEPPKN